LFHPFSLSFCLFWAQILKIMSLLKYWKPFLLAAFILVLCLIPSQDLEKIDFLKISFQDLIVHLIMFFTFSLILARDLFRYRSTDAYKGNLFARIALFSFLLAIFTEFLQLVLPMLNRSASIVDLLFDMLGIACGILVAYLTKR